MHFKAYDLNLDPHTAMRRFAYGPGQPLRALQHDVTSGANILAGRPAHEPRQ